MSWRTVLKGNTLPWLLEPDPENPPVPLNLTHSASQHQTQNTMVTWPGTRILFYQIGYLFSSDTVQLGLGHDNNC